MAGGCRAREVGGSLDIEGDILVVRVVDGLVLGSSASSIGRLLEEQVDGPGAPSGRDWGDFGEGRAQPTTFVRGRLLDTTSRGCPDPQGGRWARPT